jgi:hypothetical protein
MSRVSLEAQDHSWCIRVLRVVFLKKGRSLGAGKPSIISVRTHDCIGHILPARLKFEVWRSIPQMAETTWTYTIQDFSPLLTYAGGIGNGSNLDSAWGNVCPYQVLPDGQYYNKAICDLGSTHTTNVSGASVSLTFFGRSCRLASRPCTR